MDKQNTAEWLIKRINITIFIVIAIVGKGFSTASHNNSIINGNVRDSITGEALPYSSILLLSQVDSTFSKGVYTDVNGYYTINNLSPGNYRIIASYMGYQPIEKLISIKNKVNNYDFMLVQTGVSLSQIEITAEKNLMEKSIDKTTINISKNTTVAGGTALDVMRTLPSVDIDMDGNVNYRGSNKVIILLNGEKSELINSLDQISSEQIQKIELINNPSSKYEAEGMSGIINIILKSSKSNKSKTTMILKAGYPKIAGANVGYWSNLGKFDLAVNIGINHKSQYQTKEHLRENFENPNAFNYYQFDRQDASLNNGFINTKVEYNINKKQKIGLFLLGSKKFNNADRNINYKTLNSEENIHAKTLKKINIGTNNKVFDGKLYYRYKFKNKGQVLKSNLHYTFLDQSQNMQNEHFQNQIDNAVLQNTSLTQLNKKIHFSLDYTHPFNDNIQFETGYSYNSKNFLNDFTSSSYDYNSEEWKNNPLLANKYNYTEGIHALYIDANAVFKSIELQAGLRTEYTNNIQNNENENKYLDLFPSITISKSINNNISIFGSYTRRINRPTLKMLNPFTDEYADKLNSHRGNPDLNPEYVNSYEIGNRFISDKISGFSSIYYRDIDQAISWVKSAINDSAQVASFVNLDKTSLIGAEIAISYKPLKWWNINLAVNIFQTNLEGSHKNNTINNSKVAWNTNISNKFKLTKGFDIQIASYYKSKLPSVLGTYIPRYYMDIAISKKVLKNKGQLVLKLSDIFDTYLFGLELDAIDINNFQYSQTNQRKQQSQYLILSFIYNIKGKQPHKKRKEKYFLEGINK